MRPHAGTSRYTASERRPVDLGWLFLLPGIVLIAAAVLIAAEDDLYAARFRRDEALAIERRHAARVERYEAYLEAVRRRDPTVVRSLMAGQLNAAPTDMVEERVAGVPVYDPGQVFASLEPPEAEPAVRVRVNSVMARWATGESSRVWLMASGALCVFVGLLPPVGRRGGRGVLQEVVGEDSAEGEGADEVADGETDDVIDAAEDIEAEDEGAVEDEMEDGEGEGGEEESEGEDAGEDAELVGVDEFEDECEDDADGDADESEEADAEENDEDGVGAAAEAGGEGEVGVGDDDEPRA